MTKDYHHLCSAAPLPLPGLGDDDACHRSMTTFQPRGSSRFTGSSRRIKGPGMRWNVTELNSLLQLRCMFLDQSWQTYWEMQGPLAA